MFDLPIEIRRVVYTTNVIESLNFSLRKIIKGRSSFPNDESVYRLIYLGLAHVRSHPKTLFNVMRAQAI
jgi:putative transposase